MARVKQEPRDEVTKLSIPEFENSSPRKSSRTSKKAKATISSTNVTGVVKDEERDVEVGPGRQETPKSVKSVTKKKSKKEEKAEFQSQLGALAQTRWQEASIDPAGLDLDNSLRDVWDSETGLVARTWLAKTYGGSFVDSIPNISMDKYCEHGFWGKYMYLGLDLQPLAPQTPGSPGIWFSVGTEGGFWDYGIMRVFTRIKERPKCLWQYQGQYVVRQARSISTEEWRDQSNLVKNTWVSMLQSKPWGAWIRARVYARKYWDRESPSEEDVTIIIDQDLDSKVTEEEIAFSLSRGDERLILFTMNCIEYDYDFQRHLLAKRLALSEDDEDKKVKVEPKEEKSKRKAESILSAPKPKKTRAKKEE
ncbi:hypothetical protein NMY22_g16576 [Coprinellus aureogranulatus]|nr:hypothetical protein NMY22_g16576 [Coprinellus aureogranulatus]